MSTRGGARPGPLLTECLACSTHPALGRSPAWTDAHRLPGPDDPLIIATADGERYESPTDIDRTAFYGNCSGRLLRVGSEHIKLQQVRQRKVGVTQVELLKAGDVRHAFGQASVASISVWCARTQS
jgi:hypothetical protein